MPLFASARDASLMRRLNREMMQRILSIEVSVYKIALSETIQNIYGETSDKQYYSPVRMFCIVQRDDTSATTNELGELDVEKTVSFGFLRDDLSDIGLVVEMSDIIGWDGGYYHVDNVKTSNYWWNRNPDTLTGYQEGEYGEFGYAISIIVESHRTSMSSINIVETRSGINHPKSKVKRPRYL